MSKNRSGFVSNSSSSSFIVSLPEIPKTEEDVRRMMFGDNEIDIGEYVVYSAKEASEKIFAMAPTAIVKSEIEKYEIFGRTVRWSEFDDLIVDEDNYPFRFEDEDNNGQEYWKLTQELLLEEGKLRYDKYIEEYPGELYEFTFMDDPLEDLQDYCLLKGVTIRN